MLYYAGCSIGYAFCFILVSKRQVNESLDVTELTPVAVKVALSLLNLLSCPATQIPNRIFQGNFVFGLCFPGQLR